MRAEKPRKGVCYECVRRGGGIETVRKRACVASAAPHEGPTPYVLGFKFLHLTSMIPNSAAPRNQTFVSILRTRFSGQEAPPFFQPRRPMPPTPENGAYFKQAYPDFFGVNYPRRGRGRRRAAGGRAGPPHTPSAPRAGWRRPARPRARPPSGRARRSAAADAVARPAPRPRAGRRRGRRAAPPGPSRARPTGTLHGDLPLLQPRRTRGNGETALHASPDLSTVNPSEGTVAQERDPPAPC